MTQRELNDNEAALVDALERALEAVRSGTMQSMVLIYRPGKGRSATIYGDEATNLGDMAIERKFLMVRALGWRENGGG